MESNDMWNGTTHGHLTKNINQQQEIKCMVQWCGLSLNENDWLILGYYTKSGNGYKYRKKRQWYD